MQLKQLNIRFLVLTLMSFAVFFVLAFKEEQQAIAGQDHLYHSDDLLIVYTDKPNLSGDADQGVSIHLYRNGYVHVFYPEYMMPAGNYELYLDDSGLNSIWRLVTGGLLEFDEELVGKKILLEKMANKEALLPLSNVSDASNITIEIYPNRYQPTGYGSGDYNASKNIVWRGLKWDAKHFPQNEMLQSLVRFQDLLLSVITQGNLVRLD